MSETCRGSPCSGTRRPAARDVFGLRVHTTTYDEATELIVAAARERRPMTVAHVAVHGVSMSFLDLSFRERMNRFDLACPDGQPVRWALNVFHNAGLNDRVYGPELMLRLCARAAREGVGIYLYGAAPEVVAMLRRRLEDRFDGLRIVGCESPPFRALTPEEDDAIVERINGSGAGIVFVGIGCPKQEIFVTEHRDRVHAVLIGVGAAFDFHAGAKKMAPAWMQKRGLEWLYRLVTEPRRLFRRTLVTDGLFVLLLAARLLGWKRLTSGTRVSPRSRARRRTLALWLLGSEWVPR